jgi:hypothetical protein
MDIDYRIIPFMKWAALNYAILGGFLFSGIHSRAQNSLDILEQDLNQVKQEHQEAASQAATGFLSQLDTASGSAESALNLYEAAGGALPEPISVNTRNDYETPDEKAIRLAQDQANLSNLGTVLQLHCGLMRFAGLFIIHPEQKNLHEDWIAWLKMAAQLYAIPKTDEAQDAKGGASRGEKQKKGGGRPAPPGNIPDYREVMMKNSIISAYLGFHGWGEKEQGQWKVGSLPQLYRTDILDPLRTALSTDTLAAWDVYIAMKSADESDPDKWNEVELPALQFERASDDFAMMRSTEKLAALVGILKANPTHPQLEDWIARVHQMIKDYRDQKAGKASSASVTPPAQADDSPSTPSNAAKS